MPDAHGHFKGQGWSRSKELSWERVFASKGEHRFAHPKVRPLTRAEQDNIMRMVAQMKP